MHAFSIICSSLVLILQYLDRRANDANRYMNDDSVYKRYKNIIMVMMMMMRMTVTMMMMVVMMMIVLMMIMMMIVLMMMILIIFYAIYIYS